MTPLERIEALRHPINDGPFGLTFADMREPAPEGDVRALVEWLERFNKDQPRWPKGSPGGMGGKWAKLGDVLQAITNLIAGGEDDDSPMLKQLQALSGLLSSMGDGDGGDSGSAKPVAPKPKVAKKPAAKKPHKPKFAPVELGDVDQVFLDALQSTQLDDETSIPGVTLADKPWPGGGVNQDVTYHGVDVGSIHSTPDGEWMVQAPSNYEVEHSLTGVSSHAVPAWPVVGGTHYGAFTGFPTKEAAIQGLVDSYNSHVLGQAAITGTVPAAPGKKKVALVPAGNDFDAPSYASSPETVMINGKAFGYVYQDAETGKWTGVSLGGGMSIQGASTKLDAVEMVAIQQGAPSTLDFSGVKDAPAKAPLGPTDLTETSIPGVALVKNDPWSASVMYGPTEIGTVHDAGGTWLASNYPGLDPDGEDSTTDHATKDEAIAALVEHHLDSIGWTVPTSTDVPGVTLTHAEGDELSVHYDDGGESVWVGTVKPNNMGKWDATFPGGAISLPHNPTKDDAVKALVDHHHAMTGKGPISQAHQAAMMDSDLQTGVKGITLAHTGQSGHLAVMYDGKNIGTIYDSPVGTWVGYLPGSGIGTSEPNKDDAIELLLTDYLLNNPGADGKPVPKLPKGKKVTVAEGIDHVKEDQRKLIFSLYKAQVTGQLISSPAADNYDNLVAIGHLHGLTPLQVAEIVDDQWSKAWSAGNQGVLKKKIKDWLATPEGAAYAKAHKKPKVDIAAKMAGTTGAAPPKGVKLKPGQKVQKLSGPGGYKPGDKTHYKKIDSKAMKAAQDAYMAAHGIKLTPAQLEAVQNYTAGGYSSMNGYLRDQIKTVAPQIQQHIVQLQSAMMPLQDSVLLVRGASWDSFPEGFRGGEAAKKLIGKSIVWDNFVSTSVAGSGGEFSGAVHFEIEAPAGTMGIFVRPWSIHKSENELVLPAGTKFRVMSVTTASGYGPTVVRLRVVTPK